MLDSLTALARKSKRRLSRYIKGLNSGRRLINVPIDQLYCQDLPFSILQGFGGKPITYFPPCKFYQMSLTAPIEGYNAFYEWLRMCLLEMEAWRIPKADGGWANGSLVRSIVAVHQEHGIPLKDISEAKLDLVHEAIHRRTRYYFALLDSIKQQGFDRTARPPILCRMDNGRYILQNGHHRTSALSALGFEAVFVEVLKQ